MSGGRPKIRRTVPLAVRLDEDVDEQVRALADETGGTVSDVIRAAVRRGLSAPVHATAAQRERDEHLRRARKAVLACVDAIDYVTAGLSPAQRRRLLREATERLRPGP